MIAMNPGSTRQIFDIGPDGNLSFSEPAWEKHVGVFLANAVKSMGTVSSVCWRWFRNCQSDMSICTIHADQLWTWRFLDAVHTNVPLQPRNEETIHVSDQTDAFYLMAHVLARMAEEHSVSPPKVTISGHLPSGSPIQTYCPQKTHGRSENFKRIVVDGSDAISSIDLDAQLILNDISRHVAASFGPVHDIRCWAYRVGGRQWISCDIDATNANASFSIGLVGHTRLDRTPGFDETFHVMDWTDGIHLVGHLCQTLPIAHSGTPSFDVDFLSVR